ncbi:unnamed protein product [Gordionus sp. m RMFG-2023]
MDSTWILGILKILGILALFRISEFVTGFTSCDIPTMDRIIDIPENLPKGSIVKTISVVGGQKIGEMNRVNITLDSNPYVRLDYSGNFDFRLLRSLDAERDPISIKTHLRCIDSTTNMMITQDVSLNILDVNDNSPYFERDLYDIQTSELIPIGSSLIQNIKAIDLDIDSLNSRLTYRIEDGPYSEYFSILDTRIPTVTLVKPLDYEKIRSMHCTIIAEDSGQPKLKNSTILRVTILDGDDKNPLFYHSNYWAIVPDNYTEEVELLIEPETISAYDQDEGIKSQIVYSFEGTVNNDTTDDELFMIHPITGKIYINKKIPENEAYFIIIKATQTDNFDRYATTTLKIHSPRYNHLQDKNHNMVAIGMGDEPLKMNISEDVIPGTMVMSLGSRLGSFYPVLFEIPITEGNGTALPFNLTQRGDIIVTRSLDYEKKTFYEMDVDVIYINANKTENIKVILHILNVNDNAPKFSKDFYTFHAERKNGGLVGQINVTDGDNDDMELKIIGSKHFTIDKHGNIFMFDPEKLTEEIYEITLLAIDKGTTRRTATSQILIKLPPLNLTSTNSLIDGSDNNKYKGFWEKRDNYLIIMGALLGFALVFILLLSILIAKKKKSPDKKWLNSWNYIWKVSKTVKKSPVVNIATNAIKNAQDNERKQMTPK